MKTPTWLLRDVVLACHAESLREHGGGAGLRDEGLLDSALARPLHLFTYEHADLCGLAAAYAHGIARNHPFVDGNKRTALLAAFTFLESNGRRVRALPGHAVVMTIALADGTISESGFAAWLRDNTGPKSGRRSPKKGMKSRPARKATRPK